MVILAGIRLWAVHLPIPTYVEGMNYPRSPYDYQNTSNQMANQGMFGNYQNVNPYYQGSAYNLARSSVGHQGEPITRLEPDRSLPEIDLYRAKAKRRSTPLGWVLNILMALLLGWIVVQAWYHFHPAPLPALEQP